MPPGEAGEALGRDTLSVTADVVDAARQRQRREERAPGVGDVQRGAELGKRPVVAGAGAVEQPQSQDDAASAGAREAFGLLLGGERRAQDRRDLADRRVLGHRAVRWVDERDGGLDVHLHIARDRRVDEELRCVRAKPIVLAPRVRIRELLEWADSGREVQDTVDVAHGGGDCGGVEEIELLVSGHLELMAGGLREWPQRAAKYARSPRGQEPHRCPHHSFDRILPVAAASVASASVACEMATTLASGFLDRTNEREVLDRLLAHAREGQSAVLVIRGEAGIGKTALLRYTADQATGFRMAQVTGVEAEMELPFAGIHQLCTPALDQLGALPQPQQDALKVALGLASGPAPDRFLLGLAVLGLLSAEAEERPLLCLVEDSQWLDVASGLILGFVARRLLAESVAILVTVREPNTRHDFDGLPELLLHGLAEDDARTLLMRAVPGRLDERVRDRIVAETHGNPLALLDLPRTMNAAELAGGFELLPATDLPRHLEDHYLQRAGELPEATQRLLLLAAAEPIGDATLVWRAAYGLGIEGSSLAPAEDAQLVEVGTRVRFWHPLVRSAIYRAATLSERRAAHRALAEVTDRDTDPDRRAWHRARAAVGVDEEVAAELERSADRAQARGGAAAAAAFLAHATELTPDPAARGRRALAAAQAKFDAAASDAALELLATAELAPLDELQRARLERLRAEIAFARTRGSDAPSLLLEAARRLEPLDAAMARETHLEAIAAAMFAGRFGDHPSVREAAEAARAAPAAPQPPRAIDLLLDGLVARFTEGYSAGLPPLRKALDAFREVEGSTAGDVRWVWLACRLSQDLWDDELWHELAAQGVRVARDTGALTMLAGMANFLAALDVHSGAVDKASELIDEVNAITHATGIPPLHYAALMLAAWRGDEARMQAIADESMPSVMARGEGLSLGLLLWMTALLHNGHGRYGEALAAAQRACEYEDVIAYGWALVELIEAGIHLGQRDDAAVALDRLSERTRASGTDWALGIEAASRALLSEGEQAELLYREAVERLARSRGVVHLARARLLYGEWLRRENRRVDAREQLRFAHEIFSGIGGEGFAERAGHELLATGETVRSRTDDARGVLTPQEAHIARLARDGLSNPEIGAQLFISPRTVQYHLRKVFQKLEITSRSQLGRLPASRLSSA
jgi:DNA-binding CsgD family transcriptional regulator